MEEQKTITDKGGTMRLGAWDCELTENSIVRNVYNTETIKNVTDTVTSLIAIIKRKLKQAGMIATGLNPETNLWKL